MFCAETHSGRMHQMGDYLWFATLREEAGKLYEGYALLRAI
jgi:hypothetical protein